MFKPFDFFQKKTLKKEEHAQADATELRTLFNQLSKKKLKKFVKKAEKAYDKYVEENTNQGIGPLITFLNKRETQILFESYGLPEKVPYNSMHYFIHRDGPGEIEKNTQAWANMTASEKDDIYKEFVEHSNIQQQLFFEFARHLPESRCVDYQLSIGGRKKILEAATVNRKLRKEKNGGDNERIRTKRPKNSDYLTPFEIYRRENLEMKFAEARLNFSAFKDNEIIKYVKKAEAIYDSKKDDPQRPGLQKILNKNEMKMLFESYGMPQEVPSNVSSYYFKLHSKDYVGGKDQMKYVFEKFKKMSDEEKKAFSQKHCQDMEESLKLQRAFQEKLPQDRKSDYMDWKINKNSVKKINSERIKNSRIKSSTTNLDESDIKLELLEENGLNETESERESTNESIENEVTSKKVKKESVQQSQIDEFIANGPRKPENVLSVFLQEKMKWLPQVNMTKDDSKSFLSKAIKEWSNLNENEKNEFEEKFKNLKKEFKNKIKEFLMNKSITELSSKELTQRIVEYSLKKDKKIEIISDETEPLTVMLSDHRGRIHSDVSVINMKREDKKAQSNGKISNEEEKLLKRKLEGDKPVVNKQSKKN